MSSRQLSSAALIIKLHIQFVLGIWYVLIELRPENLFLKQHYSFHFLIAFVNLTELVVAKGSW